jgi:hypothetical protein
MYYYFYVICNFSCVLFEIRFPQKTSLKVLVHCNFFPMFIAVKVQQNQYCYLFNGSLTRDFRLQVFFVNQCPPGPQVFHWSLFEFFRKFVEIFAN